MGGKACVCDSRVNPEHRKGSKEVKNPHYHPMRPFLRFAVTRYTRHSLASLEHEKDSKRVNIPRTLPRHVTSIVAHRTLLLSNVSGSGFERFVVGCRGDMLG